MDQAALAVVSARNYLLAEVSQELSNLITGSGIGRSQHAINSTSDTGADSPLHSGNSIRTDILRIGIISQDFVGILHSYIVLHSNSIAIQDGQELLTGNGLIGDERGLSNAVGQLVLRRPGNSLTIWPRVRVE